MPAQTSSNAIFQTPQLQPGSRRWLMMAILYFVTAVCMGVFMGASHDHRLMSVHAHLNLLGWVTMTLMAVIYHFFPLQAQSRVAGTQFWLHQVGLPGMMIALGLRIYGNEAAEQFIGIFSLLVLISVLLFAGNILVAMRRASKNTVTAAPIPHATVMGVVA
jgi:uncharacterized membrane protein